MNDGATGAAFIFLILLFCFGLFLYVLPTVIASNRKHPQLGAIMALDLLLGWTFIGWVAALVWALTSSYREPASLSSQPLQSGMIACPSCAEPIQPAAKICRWCGRDVPQNT